eukprot:364515-Chlamydomonas_euryale.AAC.17
MQLIGPSIRPSVRPSDCPSIQFYTTPPPPLPSLVWPAPSMPYAPPPLPNLMWLAPSMPYGPPLAQLGVACAFHAIPSPHTQTHAHTASAL